MLTNEKTINTVILLASGTVGTTATEAAVGEDVTVHLHDENGMRITESGRVEEVLEDEALVQEFMSYEQGNKMDDKTDSLKPYRIVAAFDLDGLHKSEELKTVQASDEMNALDEYARQAMGFRDVDDYLETTRDPVYFRVHPDDEARDLSEERARELNATLAPSVTTESAAKGWVELAGSPRAVEQLGRPDEQPARSSRPRL